MINMIYLAYLLFALPTAQYSAPARKTNPPKHATKYAVKPVYKPTYKKKVAYSKGPYGKRKY